MIVTIALRELRSMFLSPLAWCILGVLQGIMAWVFLIQVDNFVLIQPRLAGIDGAPGLTDIAVVPLFGLLGILLLLVMPLMTMRLISEERRSKTLALLMSSPLSVTDIVLGKFCALAVFVLLVISLPLLMALSLNLGTDLDYGQILAGALGLALMLFAFIAIGLYVSCLTDHPTVAAVLTFGILFMLWVVNWAAKAGEEGAEVLAWLSIVHHQESFHRGLIDTGDIVYYLLMIGLFILLAVRRLDAERVQA